MVLTETLLKRLLATALLPLLLLPGLAQADNKAHTFTDLFEKQRSEAWWETMAECAGRVKSLTAYGSPSRKITPKEMEERVTMFWIIAVSRIKRDRDISEEAASKIALAGAQEGNSLQNQANLTWTAASKMDWEFDRRIDFCEKQLKDYSIAFPEDFRQGK